MFSLLKSFIVLVILGMSSLAPSAALHVGMCKQREESSTANNVQPGTAMLLTAPTRITTSLAEADEKPTSLVQPLNGVDTDNSTSESHPVSVNNDATSVAPNPRGKAATTQRTAQSNTNVASPPSAAAAEGGSGILTLNIPHQGHATNYLTSDGSGACNFKGMKISNNMLRSGIGGNNWNHGLACGMCVKVEPSQGKPLEVYIVNVTEDGDGLDMELATMIAMKGSTGGRIPITFTFVKCSFSDPIEVVLANPGQYALLITIRRTTVPVISAAVAPTGSSQWTTMTKSDPYHWSPTDKGISNIIYRAGGFDLRLTGSNGQSIIQKGVKVGTTSPQEGNVNF